MIGGGGGGGGLWPVSGLQHHTYTMNSNACSPVSLLVHLIHHRRVASTVRRGGGGGRVWIRGSGLSRSEMMGHFSWKTALQRPQK